jgi:hypothetical protein
VRQSIFHELKLLGGQRESEIERDRVLPIDPRTLT